MWKKIPLLRVPEFKKMSHQTQPEPKFYPGRFLSVCTWYMLKTKAKTCLGRLVCMLLEYSQSTLFACDHIFLIYVWLFMIEHKQDIGKFKSTLYYLDPFSKYTTMLLQIWSNIQTFNKELNICKNWGINIKCADIPPCFFLILQRGITLMASCLLPWMIHEALSKWGQLLKERICSYGSKFFPLRIYPIVKETKMKMKELLPMHLTFLLIFPSIHMTWPRGYTTFFMLNSVEHEILNAHKYKNIKKGSFLAQNSPECYFSCS